jgi:5,5'-dehydrodivanillate O-demethylase oxygenase subunit
MATTQEQNEQLTQIGPGTFMGKLLRCYWQPIGVTLELDENPVKSVRVLGEDLTLYRDRSGNYGLIGSRCKHRGVSLSRGVPDECGLRCAYHGWVYDATGQCTEQPFEDRVNPEARYKDRIKVAGYPVQELGGMIFGYLGPLPAPLLPRWDLLVEPDLDRDVNVFPLPCNWLQCMDNSVDPVHFEFLHGVFGNYELARVGKPPAMFPAQHVKIAFDVYRFGIMKRRLLEGESEDSDDWTTGHPMIFPLILAQGSQGAASLQFRLPVDDTHTVQTFYRTKKREPGDTPQPFTMSVNHAFESGEDVPGDKIPNQDFIAWVSQGPISDRTDEHLTAGDTGVILYHKLLVENAKKVENGEDPMGTIRDPAENEPWIEIPREKHALTAFKINRDYEDKSFFPEPERTLAKT